MKTRPHGQTNPPASRLAEQDRLQIALALHTPVERDVQAAHDRELSEEELAQQADALLLKLQDRSLFLDGEILGKEGFAHAVHELYAMTYRGMATMHQIIGHLEAIEPCEHELAHPEPRSDRQMVGAIVNRREDDALLADWLIGCLGQDEKPAEMLDAEARETRQADFPAGRPRLREEEKR